MPLAFRILPAARLIHVRYWGVAGIDETARGLRICLGHPEFRPGLRHLVDLRAVTGYERNYAAFLRMQAELSGPLIEGAEETIMVMVAESPPARAMAGLVMRSWDGVLGAVIRLQDGIAGALEILGLPPDALESTTPWIEPQGAAG
ncbi:hypothetical protein [Rubellimicrobium sp. CFH 75288]|uniref:hypothetical protein n=1 Tax=Rubellimicrobium sp. CFH 75288 TaxID=2697034 RepID=UPI001412226E|nr:hypothetical protein [Rubellimicrobium sp. CFH 75288]NAZ36027.1 hypothetical protein [Rubellimicrobium sp. CFH 75288]